MVARSPAARDAWRDAAAPAQSRPPRRVHGERAARMRRPCGTAPACRSGAGDVRLALAVRTRHRLPGGRDRRGHATSHGARGRRRGDMSVEDERGAGSGPSEDPTDLWQAARERGREEVRAIFAGTAAPTARTCAFCGVEAETRFEHCPRCGRSYFSRPPRLGRSARLALGGVALAAAGAAAALAGPALVDFRHASDARRAAVARATVAAERARLRAEQRPHRGDARDLRPTRDAPAAAVLRARQKLVVRLEHAITTDA